MSIMENWLKLLPKRPPRRLLYQHQRWCLLTLIFLLFIGLYIITPLEQSQPLVPLGGEAPDSPFIEVLKDSGRRPDSFISIREEQLILRQPLAQEQLIITQTESFDVFQGEIDNEEGLLKMKEAGERYATTPIPVIDMKRVTTGPSVPRKFKLYATPLGGIGNQLFQIAACIGIALETDREPMLSPAYEQLIRMFNMSLKVQNPHWKLPRVEEKGFATYSHIAYWRPAGSDAVLTGFFQSWRYFEAHREPLMRQLGLREELLRAANELIQAACVSVCSGGKWTSAKPHNNPVLLNQQGLHIPAEPIGGASKCGSESYCTSFTYIGVHVRHLGIEPNYNIAPASYFRNAMNYFRRKYQKKTIFVVVSDDVQWCLRYINGSDVYVIPHNAPDRHFAVLTRCQHHILSVGSFGWWAAWLVGGDTLYYDDPVPEYFKHYMEFVKEDYYPKRWIPMH